MTDVERKKQMLKKGVIICLTALFVLVAGCAGESVSPSEPKEQEETTVEETVQGEPYFETNDKEQYFCLGKNDTCTNMTDDPFDLYCYACDSDDDNIEDIRNKTYDWMKEQAEGKDYSYNDGGSYYCMGKNDTCPNKTSNAYDLYCSSCDRNNDNIED